MAAVGSESNSRKIITLCEKKIVSKMANSKALTKMILDDDYNRLLDQALRVMEREIGAKEADKRIKSIVKCSFKIGIMILNKEFSEKQMEQIREFRGKFKRIALTVLSFHQVDWSYSPDHLIKEAQEAEGVLMTCIKTKIKEKSRKKLSEAFSFFYDPDVLDKLFHKGEPYNDNLQLICNELNQLLDKDKI
ncbi:Tumor necrosis factor alpha-induced protein 8-like [Oopsacas minuta]|uniref:Tumor necrosis factor alpha-induced protein 8-like n=1 Tax=Oopsacas minuta TaxID=111878 RepID=A0AAV7KAC5_9METZ|nr:Tumor necrosis factor alpha-induced protein 8-like [Oopsacas minuta]